jgi:hypothetical protein
MVTGSRAVKRGSNPLLSAIWSRVVQILVKATTCNLPTKRFFDMLA